MRFRALRADEVDARVSICKENGVALLLYKDARCDMNILDETVGPYNWQRSHSRENANCTVSIWDSEKQQWISKEDTGTESNTEAEKGLASDSFKRACFNWGIGRELYTAPFIWIAPDKLKFLRKNGTKYACYDHFKVTSMQVVNGRITQLTIRNQDTKETCFEYGRYQEQKAEADLNEKVINETNAQKIDGIKWNTLISIANKKGIDYKSILKSYNLTQGSEMTMAQWMEICGRLNKMTDIGG